MIQGIHFVLDFQEFLVDQMDLADLVPHLFLDLQALRVVQLVQLALGFQDFLEFQLAQDHQLSRKVQYYRLFLEILEVLVVPVIRLPPDSQMALVVHLLLCLLINPLDPWPLQVQDYLADRCYLSSLCRQGLLQGLMAHLVLGTLVGQKDLLNLEYLLLPQLQILLLVRENLMLQPDQTHLQILEPLAALEDQGVLPGQ